MATNTPNYNFILAAIASPVNADRWGTQLNSNWTNIDSLLNVATNNIPRSVNTTPVSTSISDRNRVILIDASSANTVVNLLPSGTAGNGFSITLKRTDSSSNTLTIDANSSETIDGQETLSIPNQYSSYTLVSDGSNWVISNTFNETASGTTEYLLLETLDLTNHGSTTITSTDFASSTYTSYKFEFENVRRVSTAGNGSISLNLLGGTDSDILNSDYISNNSQRSTALAPQIINSNGALANIFSAGNYENDAPLNGVVTATRESGVNTTGRVEFNWYDPHTNASTTLTGSYRAADDNFTRVSVRASGGNLNGGRVRIYGKIS